MEWNAPVSGDRVEPVNGPLWVYHGPYTIAMPPLMCSVWPVM